jgi:hypothetical protein
MPLKSSAHIHQTLTLRLKGSEVVDGRIAYQADIDRLLDARETVFRCLKFSGRLFAESPGSGLSIQVEGIGRGLCQGWLTCLAGGYQTVESGWIDIAPIAFREVRNMTLLVHFFAFGPPVVVIQLTILFGTGEWKTIPTSP